MKFLMLPSKDSRTGKEHNLDKFGVWHPKCKPELCFPYKNVPNFSKLRSQDTREMLFWNTCHTRLRACLPNCSVPMVLWNIPRVPVRLLLMNMHRFTPASPDCCSCWKLSAMDADKCIMYGQHRECTPHTFCLFTLCSFLTAIFCSLPALLFSLPSLLHTKTCKCL